ncbi:MAG: 16S rRNA (cytidine(1402)-2'-O)-methyltransferase [Candidatus Hydrothermae bacterium]|nr:16S rRNA (cytidine(1402)-2'-O)-methyltransferase [Candidatus Hydrothermae bacterium]
MKEGILYVIGGPIGNLEDITLRALEVLRSLDVLLCEDTRRTRIILEKYGIKVKTLSYNEHNENKRIPEVIELLEAGLKVGIMSDAGTPCISDPGYRLVREARKRGINVSPIPGPSAVVAALSVSGLPTDSFVFEGFLPRKKGKRKKKLQELAEERRTVVIYESVHRIERLLDELQEIFGDREVCLARELTKLHEEVLFGRLSEVREKLKTVKGEFVITIKGRD